MRELKNYQRTIVALLKTDGIGIAKANRILESKEIAAAIADDPDGLRQELTWHLGNLLFERFKTTLLNYDYKALENKLNAANAGIITIFDDEYPFLLKQFEDRPLLLYYKGNPKLLAGLCFAVVGTRYPSKYGVRVTEDFVSALCKKFNIVSGMASGIDSVAHRTALNSGGNTIAVLGSGVDVVYPQENNRLYEEIVKCGVVVSEYELGEQPVAYNFPARNRIITGLSRGVLVTEAGIKSGTMITINHAFTQGRDVFAVPGSIYNKASQGCNKIIKETQGCLVAEPLDIFNELGVDFFEESKAKERLELGEHEKIILERLESGEAHFEELLALTELSVPKLNPLLIKMSAKGMINKCNNNFWSL